MSDEIHGYDSVVQIKDTSNVWHEVAKCKQTDVFHGTRKSADATHMRSPKGHTQTTTTLRTTAPLKLDLIYKDDDPTHADDSAIGLHYLHINDIDFEVKIILTSGKEFHYKVNCTDFQIMAVNADNYVEASAELTVLEAPLGEPA